MLISEDADITTASKLREDLTPERKEQAAKIGRIAFKSTEVKSPAQLRREAEQA